MRKCIRLSKKERYLIKEGIDKRLSARAIGIVIGRPAKTVREEIKRNRGREWYDAEKADARNQGISNRAGHWKIDKKPKLKAYILEKLQEGWSPVIIAGTWNKEKRKKDRISAETIYKWIYNYDKELYKKLPMQKKARGMKSARFQNKINGHTSIFQRPNVVDTRERVGDFETDTIYQKGNKSANIVTVVDRKSRYMEMQRNDSKHAATTNESLKQIKDKVPCEMKSITKDNGTEFNECEVLGVSVYSCTPGAPWQKGAIENINRYIRRLLDYRIPIEQVTQEMLDKITSKINNMPRKILGFLSPIEYLRKEGITI